MKACLINYNFTPDWLKDSGLDYVIYDRSDSKEYLKDFDQSRIIYTENKGNVDYDKLTYLIDNYDSLPEVFLWGKTNLFKYLSQEEFDLVKDNQTLTPLFSKSHKSYYDQFALVCYYDEEGMYRERNNSWYLNPMPSNHFASFQEWAKEFNLPTPDYIPFPPGGNFILTRETVHKHPKELYQRMKDYMGYTKLPGEAQLAERSYYLLWK